MDSLRHRVMRLGKTEPPFTGRYLEHRQRGSYRCGQCAALLFTYQQKFHSGCGWPSFLSASSGVLVRPDERVEDAREVLCGACGGHLGHLFGSAHYCINSVALDFQAEELESLLEGDFLRVFQGQLPEGFDPRARDGRGATLLTYAEQPELAGRLLDAGARVEHEAPEDGSTSVHRACERGDLALLELLWTAGAEAVLEKADFVGRTPLACAASSGQIEAMAFLVQRGAVLDAWCPLRQGVTALHEACLLDRREAALWLWRRGADADLAVGLNSSPRELKEDWFRRPDPGDGGLVAE